MRNFRDEEKELPGRYCCGTMVMNVGYRTSEGRPDHGHFPEVEARVPVRAIKDVYFVEGENGNEIRRTHNRNYRT